MADKRAKEGKALRWRLDRIAAELRALSHEYANVRNAPTHLGKAARAVAACVEDSLRWQDEDSAQRNAENKAERHARQLAKRLRGKA